MKTGLLGQAYTTRSKILACDRLVNMHLEQAPSDSKEPGMLTRSPGLVAYAASVSSSPARNLYVSSTGKCYAFFGNRIYYLVGGTFFPTTGTLLSSSGLLAVTDNGVQLFIVDGTAGYTMDLVTGIITQITDVDFPNGATMALYMDTYFLTNVPGSFRFQWSAQNDGQSWDALDFASAEGSPDYITAGIVVNREIWWFGPTSKEVFYSTGTDTVFERVTGGFTDQGCTAPRALVQADNTCFWLGQDRNGSAMIYRGRGYTSSRVSTHAIEWEISTYDDISDCIAWAHQMDGHTFIVFTFPTAGKTWVYDVATNTWHERASLSESGQFSPYRAVFHVYFEGKHLVGDALNGSVNELTFDAYDYLGDPIKSLRSWRMPNPEIGNWMIELLQIDCEMGVGLSGIAGYNTVSLTDKGANVTTTATTVRCNTTSLMATNARASLGKSVGKWYWEVACTLVTNSYGIAICPATEVMAGVAIGAVGSLGWRYSSSGQLRMNGLTIQTFAAIVTGDVIGVALDCDNETVTFYRNGVLQGTAQPIGGSDWYPAFVCGNLNDTMGVNFGATPFAYPIPSGYSAMTIPLQGSDPKVMLRVSKDGGNTFLAERTAPIGKIGQYKNKCRFRNLGQGHDIVLEMSIADPVPFAAVGAYMNAEVING